MSQSSQYRLSSSLRTFVYSCSLNVSICIITILRIKALYDLDLTDITFSIAPMGLYTLLEPTLGIVNACLPVIQPVLHKLPQLGLSSWLQGTTKRSLTGSGGPSSHQHRCESKAQRFQRLDDHTFPLTKRCGNYNEIAALECGIDLEHKDIGGQANGNVATDRERSIFVERRWGVHGSA